MSLGRPMPEETEALGDTLDELLAIGRADWYTTFGRNSRYLHAVDEKRLDREKQERFTREYFHLGGDVFTLCGRRTNGLSIPGFLTRMTAERCPKCCKLTGLPPGIGSPKNDNACRTVLGFPTS